jgi:hypothetical protein
MRPAPPERKAEPFASALLALDHSGHCSTALPTSANIFRTGSSGHADGAAPSISLAHGEGGPLGSHCSTASYAALQQMPMTLARRRRFQRTTRTNAGTSQRVVTRQGFTLQLSGSAGTAVATDDRAMLWTDGRYIWQAAQELDGYRTVMWDRLPGTVRIPDWREGELPSRIRRRLQLVSDLERNGRGDARFGMA